MASRWEADLEKDGLAHDLNNVFQTILQAADVISCDDAHVENAGIIQRSVDQARRILGMEESSEPVSLLNVMQDAADFIGDYIAIRGGSTPTLVLSSDPGIYTAQPATMHRVLVNLFLNAADAASLALRSQVEIRADCRFESGCVVLTVSDDGPGIPKDMLSGMFTPRWFTMSEGLGLRIVEDVVLANLGTIAVSNSASGGAVFTIRLPHVSETNRPGDALIVIRPERIERKPHL